jgi:hypothetical protein
VLGIRKYVSGLLPEQSELPRFPEPRKATVLLGKNPLGKKYPKLCSKDAFIFIQYLMAFGIQARVLQLNNHIATNVWNPETKVWEYHDPYFDADAKADGRNLSGAEIYDRLRTGQAVKFSRNDMARFFDTVVYVPRNNFSQGKLPSWHYFNYDNLDYWKVKRVSDNSSEYWRNSRQSEGKRNLGS